MRYGRSDKKGDYKQDMNYWRWEDGVDG